jgi:predicted nucleotidyltransferase
MKRKQKDDKREQDLDKKTDVGMWNFNKLQRLCYLEKKMKITKSY